MLPATVAPQILPGDDNRLQQLRLTIDNLDGRQEARTYATLLKHCCDLKALPEGKRIHVRVVEDGYSNSRFVANFLVLMYGKCGNVKQATAVFEEIRDKNIFSWNVMMSAYIQNGYMEEAKQAFNRMPEPNVVSWNAMVTAYAQYGHIEEARKLFDKMPVKDVTSWNSIITCYGHGREVFRLFRMMSQEGVSPNNITFVLLLKACSSNGDVEFGKLLHARLVSSGLNKQVNVGNSIVNLFGKCGCLEEAKTAFYAMPERDEVSWTSMLTALTQNGRLEEAKELFEAMPFRATASWNAMLTACTHAGNMVEARCFFERMPQRNVVSWNIMITAYTQNGFERQALHLFRVMDLEGESGAIDQVTLLGVIEACGSISAADGSLVYSVAKDAGFHLDVVVGSALITMFGRCKSVEPARAVFDELPRKNLITWNSMMAAYTQSLRGKEALELLRTMDLEGVQADRYSFLAALDACSDVAALPEGRRIHAEIEAAEIEMDVPLETALVSMYGKCGQLEVARTIFDQMKVRNVVTWSAMVAAYAQNGYGAEALEIYRLMALDGTAMNEITFVGVLWACRHGGLFEEGVQCFSSMVGDFGIGFNYDHCLSMVDLLGRSGHLQLAEDLAHGMPFEPDAVVWMALLGACRMHGDVNRAERCAARLRGLDPEDAAPYILLSNLYFSVGRFNEARNAKNAVHINGLVKKEPGFSWIEVKGRVHEFVACHSRDNRQLERVYVELDRLRA